MDTQLRQTNSKLHYLYTTQRIPHREMLHALQNYTCYLYRALLVSIYLRGNHENKNTCKEMGSSRDVYFRRDLVSGSAAGHLPNRDLEGAGCVGL